MSLHLSRNELAAIKQRLALRFNPTKNCWEVFTFVFPHHHNFKWYAINDEWMVMYRRMGVRTVPFEAVETVSPTVAG